MEEVQPETNGNNETNTSTASNVELPATNIEQHLKDMYKVVSEKIRLSVSQHQLTPESFETILVKVVETVEELAASKDTKLTGTEKRSIAINLTRLVIDDLHKNGQLTDEVYSGMNIALTFLSPLLFSAAKAIWVKLQDVVEDIQEHGTTGCFKRNFCVKRQ